MLNPECLYATHTHTPADVCVCVALKITKIENESRVDLDQQVYMQTEGAPRGAVCTSAPSLLSPPTQDTGVTNNIIAKSILLPVSRYHETQAERIPRTDLIIASVFVCLACTSARRCCCQGGEFFFHRGGGWGAGVYL